MDKESSPFNDEKAFIEWYRKEGHPEIQLRKIFQAGCAYRDRQFKGVIEKLIRLIEYRNGYAIERLIPDLQAMFNLAKRPTENT